MLQGMILESIGQLAGQRMGDLSSMQDMVKKSREQLANDKSISSGNRLLINSFFSSLEGMTKSIEALQTDADDSSSSPVENGGFEFAKLESIDVSRKIDPASQAGQMKKIKSKWDISFPQSTMWGVLACAAGFAISIARERTQGTMMLAMEAAIWRDFSLSEMMLPCGILLGIGIAGIAIGTSMLNRE